LDNSTGRPTRLRQRVQVGLYQALAPMIRGRSGRHSSHFSSDRDVKGGDYSPGSSVGQLGEVGKRRAGWQAERQVAESPRQAHMPPGSRRHAGRVGPASGPALLALLDIGPGFCAPLRAGHGAGPSVHFHLEASTSKRKKPVERLIDVVTAKSPISCDAQPARNV